jgi:hypothetical protein
MVFDKFFGIPLDIILVLMLVAITITLILIFSPNLTSGWVGSIIGAITNISKWLGVP